MGQGHRDYADKYVKRAEDVPTGEHWAIITGASVHIPGDERSRTAPGHGYQEHIESYIEYAVYLNEAKFKLALAHAIESNRGYGGKGVCGIHVAGTYIIKMETALQEVVTSK